MGWPVASLWESSGPRGALQGPRERIPACFCLGLGNGAVRGPDRQTTGRLARGRKRRSDVIRRWLFGLEPIFEGGRRGKRAQSWEVEDQWSPWQSSAM